MILEPRNLNLLRDRNQSNLSDPDSGVSSNALNNQVSPGIRANNYYDNFRSFSRQNRFSAPPLASTSRPVRAAESLPANNTTAGYNRTRKKYKINREQNRDQNSTRKRQQSNQDNAVGAGFIRYLSLIKFKKWEIIFALFTLFWFGPTWTLNFVFLSGFYSCLELQFFVFGLRVLRFIQCLESI